MEVAEFHDMCEVRTVHPDFFEALLSKTTEKAGELLRRRRAQRMQTQLQALPLDLQHHMVSFLPWSWMQPVQSLWLEGLEARRHSSTPDVTTASILFAHMDRVHDLCMLCMQPVHSDVRMHGVQIKPCGCWVHGPCFEATSKKTTCARCLRPTSYMLAATFDGVPRQDSLYLTVDVDMEGGERHPSFETFMGTVIRRVASDARYDVVLTSTRLREWLHAFQRSGKQAVVTWVFAYFIHDDDNLREVCIESDLFGFALAQ